MNLPKLAEDIAKGKAEYEEIVRDRRVSRNERRRKKKLLNSMIQRFNDEVKFRAIGRV